MIYNFNLKDLGEKLKKIEEEILFYAHQHNAVIRQLNREKQRLELMIQLEVLNNEEHMENTK